MRFIPANEARDKAATPTVRMDPVPPPAEDLEVPSSPTVSIHSSEGRRGPGRPPGAPNKKQKVDESGLKDCWQRVDELITDFLDYVHEQVESRVFNLQMANYLVRTSRMSFGYDLYRKVQQAMRVPQNSRLVASGLDDVNATKLEIFRWELQVMRSLVEVFLNHCVKIGERVFVASETVERGVSTVVMTPYTVAGFKSTTTWSKTTLYRICDLQTYLLEVRTRREKTPWFFHLKRQLEGSEAFFLDIAPSRFLVVDYDSRPLRSCTLPSTSFNAMMPPLIAGYSKDVGEYIEYWCRERRLYGSQSPRLILSLIWYIFCDQAKEFNKIIGFMSLVLRGIKRPDALLNVVGPEGCGKTLLFYILMCAILGKNNCTILQSINAVYGRFNTHKVGKYLIVNDDALPKALTGVSHMGGGDGNKSTTTGDVISVEAKGQDISQVSNVASEINLSNHFSNSLLGEGGRRLKTVIGCSIVGHEDLGLDTIMFWKWAHVAVLEEATVFAAYLHFIDTDTAYEMVSRSDDHIVQNVAEMVYTKSRTEREIMQWVSTEDFCGFGWPCQYYENQPAKTVRFYDLFSRASKSLDSDFMEFCDKMAYMCGHLIHVTDGGEAFWVEHRDKWLQNREPLAPAQYVLIHRNAIVFADAAERRMRRLRADCGFPSTGALDEEQTQFCRARLLGRYPRGIPDFIPTYPLIQFVHEDRHREYRDVDSPLPSNFTLHAQSIIENRESAVYIIDD